MSNKHFLHNLVLSGLLGSVLALVPTFAFAQDADPCVDLASSCTLEKSCSEVAMKAIAQCYVDANLPAQLWKWLDPHIERGNVNAMMIKADALYSGDRGLKANHSQAAYYYGQAAIHHNKKAQSIMCDIYADGDGVDKNRAAAIQWCELAGKNGDVNAQYRTCQLYESGQPEEINDAKSIEWCTIAANNGNADAQNELGYRYLSAQGVDQDTDQAFQWFSKAAEQGNAVAYLNLGIIYEIGLIDDPTHAKALENYQTAVDLGYEPAREYVNKIRAKITEEGGDNAVVLAATDAIEALPVPEKPAELAADAPLENMIIPGFVSADADVFFSGSIASTESVTAATRYLDDEDILSDNDELARAKEAVAKAENAVAKKENAVAKKEESVQKKILGKPVTPKLIPIHVTNIPTMTIVVEDDAWTARKKQTKAKKGGWYPKTRNN